MGEADSDAPEEKVAVGVAVPLGERDGVLEPEGEPLSGAVPEALSVAEGVSEGVGETVGVLEPVDP